MDEKQIIDFEKKYMANVYSKRPLTIVRGKGALVWDLNGKEYIDFMSAYGVCIVGHCHNKVVEAITVQAEKLISCHSSIYNDARSMFLSKIIEIAPKGISRAFISNSGAESIECAIKLTRKFTKKQGIVAMIGGFHGKTMGALSATWKSKYRSAFEPLIPNFKHVTFGDSNQVEKAIDENTGAVLVEPIQGEGGIKIPPKNYLKEIREICEKKGILLICDEVQTGLGRTGKLFAFEHSNIIPDIICLAKSVAGGVPMGITLAREEIMNSFEIGDHSSTFGGNPLACAAACVTLDIIIEEKLPERAAILGKYFIEKLERLKEKHWIVREIRGLGLMIGMDMRFDVYNLILRSIEKGVIILDAGRNILRFLPPLIINKEHIDKVIEILEEVITEDEKTKNKS